MIELTVETKRERGKKILACFSDVGWASIVELYRDIHDLDCNITRVKPRLRL